MRTVVTKVGTEMAMRLMGMWIGWPMVWGARYFVKALELLSIGVVIFVGLQCELPTRGGTSYTAAYLVIRHARRARLIWCHIEANTANHWGHHQGPVLQGAVETRLRGGAAAEIAAVVTSTWAWMSGGTPLA